MSVTDTMVTRNLLDFIRSSPTAYHATKELVKTLEGAGFKPFSFRNLTEIKPGTRGYFTRNNSSLIAFCIPHNCRQSFMIAAAHTDSPMYKIKPNATVISEGYALLNVERYGGSIYSSWLDRPLGIAGRVVIHQDNKLLTKLIDTERDVALIPSTCPHQNKTLNSGYTFNPAIDLRPIIGISGTDISDTISDIANCKSSEIVGSDLFLYNRTPGITWGKDSLYFSSPRIDNLQSVYSIMSGFKDIGCDENGAIKMMAFFDNEETGSDTKQGAASDFLYNVLAALCDCLHFSYYDALQSSFMLSVDNAQGVHPNHPELYDCKNAVHLNDGVVIKTSASGSYATDAVGCGLVKTLCDKNSIPVQYFANRSDLPGGTTLGPISDTVVSLNTCDIGLAQLAMHSAYETAGVLDTSYMIHLCKVFYRTTVQALSDGNYELTESED